MPEPSEPLREEIWRLGSRLSATGEHEISLGRLLSEDEVVRLRDQAQYLRRLADQAGYARVVECALRLEENLKRLDGEFARGLGTPASRRAATSELAALSRHLQRFCGDLRQDIAELGREGATEKSEFEATLQQLTQSDGWILLERVSRNVSSPSLRWSDDRVEVANSVDAEEWLPALATVYALAGRCQALVGAYLNVHREHFTEVAIEMRRASVEVLSGVPTIITVPLDPATGEEKTGTISFEDLPVQEIDAVAEALRHVKRTARLADEIEAATEAKSSAPSPEPPPGLSRPLDPYEPTSDEFGPGAEVADLGALVGQVVEVLPELDLAWSSALDEVNLEDVRANTEISWQTLVAVLQRQMVAVERQLATAGVDARFPAFPPSADDIARYWDLPADDRRWRLLQMAEIWSMTRLLEAMGAVTEKSGRKIDLASGEVQNWWESGAFSLVRLRALSLLRIARHARQAEGAVTGEDVAATLRLDAEHELQIAVDSELRGDSDAALLHCACALRTMSEHALAGGDLPPDYLDRLRTVPSSPDDGYALELARDVVRSSIDEARAPGEVTVLSNTLIPLTSWLLHQVSESEIKSALERPVEHRAP